ncbi:MAG TPA: outer membrane lipoprotein-sorting protein [Bacteroidales bacterium]|nr:outer membrane lipoprotein-sorting protein [Bacteroidales bacterium]
MKTCKLIITTVTALLMISPMGSKAEEPLAIIKKMDKVLYGPDDQTSTVRMILTDRGGNERIREANIWQKGSDKRLFRFTAPAAETGIAFLSLPGEVMYIYMPAFGRERRIASHVKNQSFAGTDFTYEDLEAKEYAKTYSPSLIEEKPDKYILEMVPLPSYRSDYSKLIVAVNKQHFYPETMEAYDRGGNKVKSSVYTWKQKDGFWYAYEIHATDLKRSHSTRMIMTDVDFNTEIDDQIFTVRNLTR